MNMKMKKLMAVLMMFIMCMSIALVGVTAQEAEGNPDVAVALNNEFTQDELTLGEKGEFGPAPSALARFFSSLGQAFVFTDPVSVITTDQFVQSGSTYGAFSYCDRESQDNIPSITAIEGVGPVRCDPDGTNRRGGSLGAKCASGEYVHVFWYPDASNKISPSGSDFTVARNLFSMLWMKEFSTDNVRLTSYDVNTGNDQWWAGYNCYKREASTAQTVDDTPPPQEEETQPPAEEQPSTQEDATTTDTTTTSDDGLPVGWFRTIQIPSQVEAGQSMTIKGEYVARKPTEKILIEANLVVPSGAFSIVQSTSSASACDGSEYYAGDYVYDLKAGDVVQFEYTFRAVQTTGSYPVNVQVWSDCFVNGGEQLLFYNTKSQVTVTEPVQEGADDDADNDGVPNDTDNCPRTTNPDQSDADLDGFGDSCDVCITVPGVSPLGCPPCFGQGDLSSCEVSPDVTNNQGDTAETSSGAGDNIGETDEDVTDSTETCNLGEFKTSTCGDGSTVMSQVCVDGRYQAYADCNGNVAELDRTQLGIAGLLLFIIVGGGITLLLRGRRKSRRLA